MEMYYFDCKMLVARAEDGDNYKNRTEDHWGSKRKTYTQKHVFKTGRKGRVNHEPTNQPRERVLLSSELVEARETHLSRTSMFIWHSA